MGRREQSSARQKAAFLTRSRQDAALHPAWQGSGKDVSALTLRNTAPSDRLCRSIRSKNEEAAPSCTPQKNVCGLFRQSEIVGFGPMRNAAIKACLPYIGIFAGSDAQKGGNGNLVGFLFLPKTDRRWPYRRCRRGVFKAHGELPPNGTKCLPPRRSPTSLAYPFLQE